MIVLASGDTMVTMTEERFQPLRNLPSSRLISLKPFATQVLRGDAWGTLPSPSQEGQLELTLENS